MYLTFYFYYEYSILRFFEGWMDYISGGNLQGVEPAAATRLDTDIYRRFNFPEFYKCQKMTITKFERDYDRELTYTFVNAFPKGLTSIPVSYGPADLLKVTVTFNYDRYVVSRGFTGLIEKEIRDKALTATEPFKDPRIPGTVILPIRQDPNEGLA